MSSVVPELLAVGSRESKRAIVLAHGAGAAMDTPFMNAIADGLAERGEYVVRFEFPYMAERRRSGKNRAPNSPGILRQTWQDVIDALRPIPLVIGGKSMGGRIASMIADEAGVDGVVCLGYPFHPVGKPDQLRIEHLQQIKTPTLIVQGERDPFGNQDEVHGYQLSSNVQLHWLRDGDHSFKPRKASGVTLEQNLQESVQVTAEFVSGS